MDTVVRSDSVQAALLWQRAQKSLSIGLELECFFSDLGVLLPSRLLPLQELKQLYDLVARRLSERLEGHRLRVSAEAADWGRLWTATGDGSIRAEGVNPFAVELVSKRMGFDELDVALFCDVTHALSAPPLCAKTNESTGLHVHLGRYPGFFSVEELGAIFKAYLRLEPAINLLLPVTRQRNRFCRDFRDTLAKAQGLSDATEDQLLELIDRAVKTVKTLPKESRAVCLEGRRVAVSKADLLVALLGEGGSWRLKRSVEVKGLLLPAGLELRELWSQGRLLWKVASVKDLQALWGKDGNQSLAEHSTPWSVLQELSEQELLDCVFQKPQEVPPECLEHWLLRDALILERHGTRYCKLNIMRICCATEKATLEFRQFPGGDFGQPLLIWGWVKFLGILVSYASAGLVPKGSTLDDLKDFLCLRSDSLLLAWFRDLQNRLTEPELCLQRMQRRFEHLWELWAKESETEARCRAWRRIFQAASAMKSVFPPGHEVWMVLSERRGDCEAFMQELYEAMVVKLRSHLRLLASAEEVSRCCGLETVLCMLSDGRLRRSDKQIRQLQAAVHETLGWELCPTAVAQRMAELGRRGAELTLDYASHLLRLCETTEAKAALGRWRCYAELCDWLLLPHSDEVVPLWAGMALRGWDSDRVQGLWCRLQDAESRALAAAWFAARKRLRASRKSRAGLRAARRKASLELASCDIDFMTHWR